MEKKYDVVVVGSGPNGLAAGIVCARAGLETLLIEAKEMVGGGLQTAEVTLPGFLHDICSAIHPMGVASPFFSELDLTRFGMEWKYSPVEVAHPLGDEKAVLVSRSVEKTAEQFGDDGEKYCRLLTPFIERWSELSEIALAAPHFPKSPLLAARFGIHGLRSAKHLALDYFSNPELAAMLAGLAGHSVLSFDRAGTSAFAMLFAITAHSSGWPFPKGGAATFARALGEYFKELGGEMQVGSKINSFDELPAHKAVLFDLTPKEFLRIGGEKISSSYRSKLQAYRYGPGVFKIDYALSGPTPFLAAGCREAATVHLGGSFQEIAHSEREVAEGKHPEKPFVLFAQHTPFDSSRAPDGKHTAWAYCHVPNGSTKDMTQEIETQIERFAPGFQDLILKRATLRCSEFETMNPNYVGGDINGGALDLKQLMFRPIVSMNPYRTPMKGIYLCSAATPPGSGVHGMGGMHAAITAIRDCFPGVNPMGKVSVPG